MNLRPTVALLVASLAATLSLTACPGCQRPIDDDDDGGAPLDAGDFVPTDGGARDDAGAGEDAGEATPIVVCPDPPLATPPAGSACAVSDGNAGLAITGTLLLPGSVVEGGTVVVDDEGVIVCSGCDCADEAVGKTALVCPDAVVSPGLINAHDHMGWMNGVPWVAADEGVDPDLRWEHRHDWRRGRRGNPSIEVAGGGASTDEKAYGELRFVLSGATSINGSGSAPGFLRNVDTDSALEGLAQPEVRYETFPLDDANGLVQSSGCAYGEIDDVQSVDAYTPHVAEGIDVEARNEFLCLTGQGEGSKDTLRENSAIIHGVGLLPDDVATMAARGVKLIWSPRSNVALYGNTAPIPLMKRLGVEIGLGTDWIPSGSMNMLRELQCADSLNRDRFGGALSDEDLWRTATLGSARAIAMDDALGVLLPGRVADVAIYAKNGREGYRAVIDAQVEDVALVLRGGQPLSGDAPLVAALEDGCDVLDVCGVEKRVCVEREIGKSLAELQSAVGTQYLLFPCDGPPADEPTCTPSRSLPADVVDDSTAYTGARSDDDPDGDGIGDGDVCPSVFDPARPLDDGDQGDADGDGVGDACDVCPLAADQTDCPTFDPDDGDGDGRTDLVDNCPDDANPNQLDGDDDGKGDACDACPAYQNPGDAGCAAVVYDVKTNAALVGERVAVLDLIVTGVASNGFFAQLDPASALYQGVEHSGVFAYTGANPRPARGDRVNIVGATVAAFFGQIQLSSVEWTTTATGLVVAPRVLTTSELADAISDGATSAFEGVLVEVDDVVVTNATPPAGPGDAATGRNEFEVAGGLYVDDLLFLLTPQPANGETFASIAGPLAWRNDHLKLLPRDQEDLVFGSTSLASFGPPTVYQRIGAAGPTFPAALVVRLGRATTSDTTVLVTSSDDAIAVVDGAQVVVPAGALEAQVPVRGVADGTATLTAKLSVGDVGLSATVRVLATDAAAAVASLSPATLTAAASTTATFTVTLDLPAPAGGADVVLATDRGAVPATVHVEADATTATFEWTTGAEAGAGTITATLGGQATATVQVVAFVGGLVINEIDYDQEGTDATEFVEIYNGTNAPADLTGHKLVFVNGSNNTVYRTVELGSAGVLPPAGFLVVASSAVAVADGGVVIRFAGPTNNIENGDPDGVALVSATALVDALSYEGGMTAVPLGTPYGTVTLVPPGGGDPDLADSNAEASQSLARVQDGVDTGKDSDDWMVTMNPTPGAPNVP